VKCRLPILLLALAAISRGAAVPEDFDAGRFEKELIVPACNDPMQLEVLPDGRVYFIERAGALRMFEPQSRAIVDVGAPPIFFGGEAGLLGLALDRDFARTQMLYLFFSPKEKANTLWLSRFTLKDGKLDIGSEKVLLDYPTEDATLNHQGGGLFMAANGDLILGTGDNTPPIPELQVDQRPGRETFDAQRTSANSLDLRGKILRIHPTPDGGYTIPPGNLFPDGKGGRAEIFAMGVRNGFRVFADAKTGWIYWGDVGQNITATIGVGPDGYDEINQARAAGNFGWPYFTGPNEAYRNFDFTTRQAGALFDVKAPRNDSRNNTGAHVLPPPQPAFIWYPSTESKEFPTLGSGGRAAMTGPFYRFDAKVNGDLKLPEHFDNCLFIYDWMRNWIQTVKLDAEGHIARIEPFLPAMRFRKPIELKLAPDHTLYVIETGDKWMFNTDSQIFRIVYRRGHRAPVAIADATPRAGRQPLRVRFNARRSTDKDGDALTYAWKFGDAGSSSEAAPEFLFENPGTYPVMLTATDAHGASSVAQVEIRVGNAPPQVTLVSPANGSFYDPGQTISYRVSVTDPEDGSTDDGTIPPTRVLLTTRASVRATSDETTMHPGLKLMRATTCFGCHTTTDKSVGPPYAEVASKYQGDPTARERLAQKIITGGTGVWSKEIPMPPHPQHTLEQTRQMVDWVLSLNGTKTRPPLPGLAGMVTAPQAGLGFNFGFGDASPVFILTASYNDNGAQGQPPLRGEAVAVLHPRRKRAASFDAARGVETVDVFEGREGNVARLSTNGWFKFANLNLAGITQLCFRAAPLVLGAFDLEVHLDTPEGPLLGTHHLVCQSADDMHFTEFVLSITPPEGLRTLCFLAKSNSGKPARLLDVNWVEFRASTSPGAISHN